MSAQTQGSADLIDASSKSSNSWRKLHRDGDGPKKYRSPQRTTEGGSVGVMAQGKTI